MVAFALAHGTARVRRPCAQVHPSTHARPSGDKAAPLILFACAFPRRRLLGCPRRPGLAVAGQAAHAVAKGRGTDSLAAKDAPYLTEPRTHARSYADRGRRARRRPWRRAGLRHAPPRRLVAIPTLRSGRSSLTRVHTTVHAVPFAPPRPARVGFQRRRRAAAAPTPTMAARNAPLARPSALRAQQPEEAPVGTPC
jgi:hypothetical protein